MPNDWRTAFLKQAPSDFDVLQTMIRDDFPLCHRLHYLQMTTEKLAKGQMILAGGARLSNSHNAFVRFIQTAGVAELYGICGFTRQNDFKRHLEAPMPNSSGRMARSLRLGQGSRKARLGGACPRQAIPMCVTAERAQAIASKDTRRLWSSMRPARSSQPLTSSQTMLPTIAACSNSSTRAKRTRVCPSQRRRRTVLMAMGEPASPL